MSSIIDDAVGRLSTDGITLANPTVNFDGTNTVNFGTFYAAPFRTRKMDTLGVSFVCPAANSPAGTLKFQVCFDPIRQSLNDVPQAGDLPNWIDLPWVSNVVTQTTWTISGATSLFLSDYRVSYPWIRAVFALTSGAIIPTLRYLAKGEGGR